MFNQREADRQLRKGWIQTGLILGGMATAAAIGQLIFRKKFRRNDALMLAMPLGRVLMEEFMLRKQGRLPRTANIETAEIYHTVLENSGMKQRPELIILDTPDANAMAAGLPGFGKVAVMRGLADKFPADEQELVIAHELAHIKHQDGMILNAGTVLMGLVQKCLLQGVLEEIDKRSKVGARVANVAFMIAGNALLVYLLRVREASADAGAAKMTGNPEPLIRALERLSAGPRRRTLRSLIPTHPPVKRRIENLRRMTA